LSYIYFKAYKAYARDLAYDSLWDFSYEFCKVFLLRKYAPIWYICISIWSLIYSCLSRAWILLPRIIFELIKVVYTKFFLFPDFLEAWDNTVKSVSGFVLGILSYSRLIFYWVFEEFVFLLICYNSRWVFVLSLDPSWYDFGERFLVSS
jgi:hypothetical protein